MQMNMFFITCPFWKFFGYTGMPKKRTGIEKWLTSKETEQLEYFLKREFGNFGVALFVRSVAENFKHLTPKAFFDLMNQHYFDGYFDGSFPAGFGYRPSDSKEVFIARTCLSDYEYGDKNSDYVNFMKHAVMYGVKPVANSKFDISVKRVIPYYQDLSNKLAIGLGKKTIGIYL